MALRDYKRKHDFTEVSAPLRIGESIVYKPEGLFVIQKQAARLLHYDFRLELAGHFQPTW
jgi:hypothetical protein